MEPTSGASLWELVPLLFLSILVAPLAYLLAKQKGRNVVAWTILGLIPMVNFMLVWYFVGATNLRLEKKVDELLEALKKG